MFYDDLTVVIVDHVLQNIWIKKDEIYQDLKISHTRKRVDTRIATLQSHGLISEYCTRCKKTPCSCGRYRKRLEDEEIEEKISVLYFNYDDFYASVTCRLYYLDEEFSTVSGSDNYIYRCETCDKEMQVTKCTWDAKNHHFLCPDCESKIKYVRSGEGRAAKKRKHFDEQMQELNDLLKSLKDEKRPNNHPQDEDHEATFHQLMGLKRREFREKPDAKRMRKIIYDLAQKRKIAVLFSDEEDEDGKISHYLAQGMTFAEAVKARDKAESEESSTVDEKEEAQLAALRNAVPWFLTRSSVTGEQDFNLIAAEGMRSEKQDRKKASASSKLSEDESELRTKEAYLELYESGDMDVFPDCWGEDLSEKRNSGWKLWRDDYQKTRGIRFGEGGKTKEEIP